MTSSESGPHSKSFLKNATQSHPTTCGQFEPADSRLTCRDSTITVTFFRIVKHFSKAPRRSTITLGNSARADFDPQFSIGMSTGSKIWIFRTTCRYLTWLVSKRNVVDVVLSCPTLL